MNIKQLIMHLLYSFLVIFSGIFVAMYIFMLFLGIEAYTFRDLTGLVIISVAANMTQIILYSKKELSKKQTAIRYAIILLLALIINFTVLISLGLIGWDEPLALGVYAIFVVIVGFMLHYAVTMVKRHVNFKTAAFTDALTGAHNRRYFIDMADRTLLSCVNESREFALIMLDLDHFKSVNDTYGHAIGDEVLKIAVGRTRSVLKNNTLVARCGGEEFVVMIVYTERKNVEKLAWRMQKNLTSSPFQIGELEIGVTASFGIAMKTRQSTTLTQIMDNADKALYQAKVAGRNTVVYYDCTDE
jgi:diguanylate cyclase (GGDEF)-like protein